MLPGSRHDRWARLWAWLSLAAVSVGVALEVAAMARYPGGTWCDHGAVGHRFFGNFLSDLTHARAIGGASNAVGATLARAGLLSLGVAVACFWQALGAVTRSRLVRALGTVSSAGVALVVATPTDRVGWLHGLAVLVAAAPGLLAGLLSVASLLRSRRASGALGVLALVSGGATAAVYAVAWARRADCVSALPAMQKVAAIALLAWVFAVSIAVLRRPARG